MNERQKNMSKLVLLHKRDSLYEKEKADFTGFRKGTEL